MAQLVTVFIERDASVTFLKSPLTAGFNLGPSVTRRYSSVEPDCWYLRLVFLVLRWVSNDTGVVANWTRNWRCLWRAHIKNGPVLPIRSRVRQQVIDAEISYFNQHGVNHDCHR
jgi:hypothetical protein